MPAKKTKADAAKRYIDTYPTNAHQVRTLARFTRRRRGKIAMWDDDVRRIEAAQDRRERRAALQGRGYVAA